VTAPVIIISNKRPIREKSSPKRGVELRKEVESSHTASPKEEKGEP